jgi:hypothetical protein
MPWRNRVTPFGEIIATDGRGLLLGNRGILHNQERQIVRDSHVRRWIACRLEFHGRHRQVMTPGTWTELFFLDEATALSAGHRPCAECRHADFVAFQSAWRRAFPNAPANADAIDRVLHAERRAGPWRKRTSVARLGDVANGAFIASDDGRAWLVQGRVLRDWTSLGYQAERVRDNDDQPVTLLTPPSLNAVLRAGYEPLLHPTAARERH